MSSDKSYYLPSNITSVVHHPMATLLFMRIISSSKCCKAPYVGNFHQRYCVIRSNRKYNACRKLLRSKSIRRIWPTAKSSDLAQSAHSSPLAMFKIGAYSLVKSFLIMQKQYLAIYTLSVTVRLPLQLLFLR